MTVLPAYAVGFSARKRPLLRAFYDEQPLRFCSQCNEVPDGADLVVWGAAPVPDQPRFARVLRVEDGFVRSVGLGAAFARPLSWVIDPVGIHYDPAQPSLLEDTLQRHSFTPELLARAAQLRARIVRAGLTKYNLAAPPWTRPGRVGPVLLVVGQVETDQSLRLGSPHWHSNVALLRELRRTRPDAYLLYKPHPDVCAGLRRAGSEEHLAGACCDEVLMHGDMAQLVSAVDECHVLTSLAGFEALLRGARVVAHGLPFYSGWGLTQDMLPLQRRSRRLSLDELVAGTLLLYPRYFSQRLGRRVPAEMALDELEAQRAASGVGKSLHLAWGAWAGRLVNRIRTEATGI